MIDDRQRGSCLEVKARRGSMACGMEILHHVSLKGSFPVKCGQSKGEAYCVQKSYTDMHGLLYPVLLHIARQLYPWFS